MKRGEAYPYPTPEQLRAEGAEDPATVIFTITDSHGDVVRRIEQPATAGLHRHTWDMRGYGAGTGEPAAEEEEEREQGQGGPRGRGGRGGAGGPSGAVAEMAFQVMPGEYRVAMSERVNGMVTELVPPVPFRIEGEADSSLSDQDRKGIAAYRERVSKLQRAVSESTEALDMMLARIAAIKQGVIESPRGTPKMRQEAVEVEEKLRGITIAFRGDDTSSFLVTPPPYTLVQRVNQVTFSQFGAPTPPTKSRLDSLRVAEEEFGAALPKLREIANRDMPRLEKELDAAGIVHKPGRVPDWK